MLVAIVVVTVVAVVAVVEYCGRSEGLPTVGLLKQYLGVLVIEILIKTFPDKSALQKS